MQEDNFLSAVSWNSDGLLPVIAQDRHSGQVLMMAWMNEDALRLSIAEGRAVYWSRSRGKLWRKGESSGNVQLLHDVRLDCDGDTLLLTVEQRGGVACHTGREHCFYRQLTDGQWQVTEPVVTDPAALYGNSRQVSAGGDSRDGIDGRDSSDDG